MELRSDTFAVNMHLHYIPPYGAGFGKRHPFHLREAMTGNKEGRKLNLNNDIKFSCKLGENKKDVSV